MRLAAVALILVVAGCDTRVTYPGRGTEQPPPMTAQSALVGRWSFTRYLYDDSGTLHLSQTVWEFAASGAVTRTVYADNVTAGLGDAVVSPGNWEADARTVRVLFAGSTSATQYEYRFDGGNLVLGGITFVRLLP